MSRTLSVGVALGGFAAVLMQALLIREFLATFSGNELAIGLVLVSWMVYIAAGADAFARLRPALRDTPGAFTATQVVAGLWCPVAVYLSRMVGGLIQPNGPAVRDLILLPALALAPLCLALGAQFAVACGLAHAGGHRHPPAAVAARLALGGVLAGLLYTFVLADHVNPMLVAFALAGAGLLCTAWVALASRPRAGTAAMLVVGVALGGYSALLTVPTVQTLCVSWPGRAWKDGDGSAKRVVPATTWYTRHGVHSRATLVADPYGQMAGVTVAAASRPGARNVLIIGEGTYGLPGMLGLADRDHRVQHLDFAADDLEAADTMRALLRPEAPTDPRVRLLRTPVRDYLRHADGSYDMIAVIGASYARDADANRYCTREFLSAARRALAPDGVLCVGVSWGDKQPGPAGAGVMRALQEVFPETPVLSLGGSGLLAATRALQPTAEARSLAGILLGSGVEAVPPVTDAPANSDLRPAVYAESAWRWWGGSGASSAPPLPFADGAPAVSLALLMAVPALLLAYQWRRSPRIAFTGWAVFCAGFVTISVQLTAFLAAQSQTGEIPYLSGLLLAALMAGTGIGATWGARAQAEAQALADLRRAQLSLLMLCLIAPLLVTAIPTLPAMMLPLLVLLLVGSGFLAGAIYPLAVAIYGNPVYGAASLHALGLVGGASAAALLCTVIVPAAGIPAAMMAAAAVAACGMFGVPIVRALLR